MLGRVGVVAHAWGALMASKILYCGRVVLSM